MVVNEARPVIETMGTHRRRVCHEANSSRLSFVFFRFGSSLPPLFPGLGLFPPRHTTRHTCQHSLNTRATCLSLNGPRNLYFAEAYARLVKRGGLLTRRNLLPAVFPFLYRVVPSLLPSFAANSSSIERRLEAANDSANISLESIEKLENFRENQEIVRRIIGSFEAALLESKLCRVLHH